METDGIMPETEGLADLLCLAKRTLKIKPACDRCGYPFLHGSERTCSTCLRHSHTPQKPRRRSRLKCDCGELAVAVVFVGIKAGDIITQEPLPMCEDCLRIEIDTVMNYL